MKRITGTHVYTYLRCPRAVALDLHGDRALRRPTHPWEEFVLARGRQVEADYVAGLPDYVEPDYPPGQHASGAAATLELLREGVVGISQGVLLRGDRLGIPDLLRRVPLASELGEHSFEVLDIKSSGRSRGDQVLQVSFYSRLLAEVQGRLPECGSLILKDGREERFKLADFEPALDEVEAELRQVLADPDPVRPFWGPGCSRCRWSELCAGQLEEAEDLSLLQGLTRGMRTLLEGSDMRTWAEVAGMSVDRTARRTHIPAAQLRRLARAAKARRQGRPEIDQRADHPAGALLHFLTDPFEERVLFMGVLQPAHPQGEIETACPRSQQEEWPCFEKLIEGVAADQSLLHYGPTVPAWIDETVSGPALSDRLVDLARQLRGAAVYPGPVFGLAEHVRLGLGEDPHREGHADAAALWAGGPEGEAWLVQKGASDLRDQARLIVEILGGDATLA